MATVRRSRVLPACLLLLVHTVGVFPADAAAGPLSADRERALKPKDTFMECDVCPEMVVVPAGSFTTGSPASETQRDSDERPQHEVRFARPFAVGKFSVTFAEWDACVADGGCNRHRPVDQGWGRGRRPVINVSWDDAKAYVTWLSGKTGHGYRLLSESEREYVTRAGTTTPPWSGSSIVASQADYDGSFTHGGGSRDEYWHRTVPVDTLQPNPWGLYQMHGNVWEWVEDCWHGDYRGAPTDGSAWTTGGECGRRLLRGGSWVSYRWGLRSANRIGLKVGDRDGIFGFRVARTLLMP
jgi:formylglycine-generating enzyme required for sulfatase activity